MSEYTHNDDVADLLYVKDQEIAELVARLREYAVEPGRYWLDNYALQGANYLERLRTENIELQDAINEDRTCNHDFGNWEVIEYEVIEKQSRPVHEVVTANKLMELIKK